MFCKKWYTEVEIFKKWYTQVSRVRKVVYASVEGAKSGIRKCRGCEKWYTEVSRAQKVVYGSILLLINNYNSIYD